MCRYTHAAHGILRAIRWSIAFDHVSLGSWAIYHTQVPVSGRWVSQMDGMGNVAATDCPTRQIAEREQRLRVAARNSGASEQATEVCSGVSCDGKHRVAIGGSSITRVGTDRFQANLLSQEDKKGTPAPSLDLGFTSER